MAVLSILTFISCYKAKMDAPTVSSPSRERKHITLHKHAVLNIHTLDIVFLCLTEGFSNALETGSDQASQQPRVFRTSAKTDCFC